MVPKTFETCATAITLGSVGKHLLKATKIQLTGTLNGSNSEFCPRSFTGNLPRKKVRVVLHLRNNNFVARLKPGPFECVSDKVHRLSGAAKENDLFRAACP